MTDMFLNEVFSFPLNIFSTLFVILLLFWLVSFLGLVDIEIIDPDIEVDTDAESGQTSWLQKLGLDGVPLMVVITLIDFYALIFAYLGRKYLMPLADEMLTATAMGSLLAMAAVVIALPLTTLSVKPLRRFFHTHEAVSKCDITGTICTVTTLKVTESFGQAITEDGSMVLSVRADEPNTISKGERVALISYDNNKDTYLVVTEQQLLNQ
ncbi:hypothetical protein C2869_09635 [Saccharobesus litoralis]|uniref:Inner membrane protein YqiJ N-terminal domain-containing protein n=2 Tax=Saccharobesus litoralis TaxID=2172099 RepID=A0A2S0VXN2_9ALTE|nr:hypothetical protein C2869_09635 [Saccharobesus litoralis]